MAVQAPTRSAVQESALRRAGPPPTTTSLPQTPPPTFPDTLPGWTALPATITEFQALLLTTSSERNFRITRGQSGNVYSLITTTSQIIWFAWQSIERTTTAGLILTMRQNMAFIATMYQVIKHITATGIFWLRYTSNFFGLAIKFKWTF